MDHIRMNSGCGGTILRLLWLVHVAVCCDEVRGGRGRRRGKRMTGYGYISFTRCCET